MIVKTVEIRDIGTFIPAMAIRLVPVSAQDRYLFGRAGYGFTTARQSSYIVLMRLAGGSGHFECDPYYWNSSTMKQAHIWLVDHFDEIESGAVVDVEFITGRTAAPKRSEAEGPEPR